MIRFDIDKQSENKTRQSKIILSMFFVMLAVFVERLNGLEQVLESNNRLLSLGTLIIGFAVISMYHPRLIRWSPWILILGLLPILFYKWTWYANHGWLAIWILIAAPASQWWEDEDYWTYVRLTMGIVMLAAALQKLLAGTYLDGSYISYLSYKGGTTEQLFGFLCDQDKAMTEGCAWHKFIGTSLVVWQAIVGLLLLIGLRSLSVFFIEIAFLIGAGIYADELNFQVLNIAFLCIAFGIGMPRWLAIICSIMLIIDFFSLTRIVDHVLGI